MHCNITFSARFHYRQGGGVALHNHSLDYQIQLVYGGFATTMVNDLRFPIREGDVVFIPRGANHRFFVGRDGMKTLEVKFTVDTKETEIMLSHINSLNHVKDSQLFDVFSQIVAEGSRKSFEYKTMSEALLEQSLVILARLSSGNIIHETENPIQRIPNTGEISPAIQAANDYIYRHMNKNFSMAELAKGSGYNQDYLYRTIKKECGMSAIKYVNKLRFEQAKRLMQHTELPLSEIAWNLGFDSIQYFSKFFHRYAKIAPSIYCERVRSAIRIDY
ncbi:MAG: helix-turn-helix domain-containing protein [Sphaerochaetaceae bacterium]|jgi:YesN/AraC family two-component response regulator